MNTDGDGTTAGKAKGRRVLSMMTADAHVTPASKAKGRRVLPMDPIVNKRSLLPPFVFNGNMAYIQVCLSVRLSVLSVYTFRCW